MYIYAVSWFKTLLQHGPQFSFSRLDWWPVVPAPHVTICPLTPTSGVCAIAADRCGRAQSFAFVSFQWLFTISRKPWGTSSSWEHSSLNNQNFWNNSEARVGIFPEINHPFWSSYWGSPLYMETTGNTPICHHWVSAPLIVSRSTTGIWTRSVGRFWQAAFFRRVVRRNQKQQQCWKIKYPT